MYKVDIEMLITYKQQHTVTLCLLFLEIYPNIITNGMTMYMSNAL